MFTVANHEIISKIESIDLVKLLFKGEVATCYEYRNKVVAFINQAVSEVEDKSTLDEDLEVIYNWFVFRNLAKYWQSAQKEKSASEMADWILENAANDLINHKAEKSFEKAAKVPSESEKEDAYQWIESSLKGSEKQINWAKAIAHKHHNEIIFMWAKNKKLPVQAKWWIDNRDNILVALNNL